MNQVLSRFHPATSVLIMILFVTVFFPGCKSEEASPQQLESLSDAQLLPSLNQTPDTEAGPSFINVLSSNSETNFPKSLTFNVVIESSHVITDVELRYKIRKMTTASVITTITPEFKPERRLSVEWTWDTRKFSLPPGAEIDYQWMISNAAGDEIETEMTTLIFEDSRHNWNNLIEGNIRLFWYEGNDEFARKLMNAAQSTLEMLARDTGARLERTAQLFIYANTKELQDALIFPQEWTGGLAFTDYGIITIGIEPDDLSWGTRVIAHELTHLVIRQITYSPLSNVPTWLNEGLAMHAEGALREDLKRSLEKAISNDTLFPIRSLGGSFPADSDDAMLAYAQSYSVTVFLIENYDRENMYELLQLLKNGVSYDDALLEAYGFDLDGLDARWKESLGLPASTIPG